MGRSTLKEFLEAAEHDRFALSFRQVEVLLGEALPPSLRTGEGWKNPQADAVAVLDDMEGAGFVAAEVDPVDGRVVLQRTTRLDDDRLEPASEAPRYDEFGRRRRRHPAFGLLKGFITVEPGYDLTRPLFEDSYWDERMDEKYGA
ncbi:hypothetical protein [Oharaeibacter diazotrophicus]|uniref:Uncharacterized protein n=1 Tax=Oharaeibacter diazotrophicus TaxID=1920512 RepID=A0A4R6RBR2_9HYPH|nr:hypothetical protein [Oharaeibacter diazotrophicus]TDP83591.1 hypothetical protein EDD54_3553 [Oharaeibacter diazotrophicus]BBE72424.1 hypothetical protein OHA_1_02014 [Pleomorphomonas sp. SM30]GLS79194.1 hypothetical protein GCM10007904_45310 [Oharaeibacter diazotrophicus]